MVPYAEFLSQERKAYYNRLSSRLIEMSYAAVHAGDWERVITCAKQHLALNRAAEFELITSTNYHFKNAINTKLLSIDHFCHEDGWV